MTATAILTDVALLLVVWVLWDEAREPKPSASSRRTRLTTAAIFAGVGIVTSLLK